MKHAQHLRCVFEALQQHGLTVKEAKCEFGRSQIEYLGHVIGNRVLAVPHHSAEAMANFIQPRTKKQLRAFLGAASYYRRFVKGFTNYSSMLTPRQRLVWLDGRRQCWRPSITLRYVFMMYVN